MHVEEPIFFWSATSLSAPEPLSLSYLSPRYPNGGDTMLGLAYLSPRSPNGGDNHIGVDVGTSHHHHLKETVSPDHVVIFWPPLKEPAEYKCKKESLNHRLNLSKQFLQYKNTF